MQRLAAPLVIKNYVHMADNCNNFKYEDYLIEMLNASSWVNAHFKSEFIAPPSESDGECDSYSDGYGLDFKLIASKTMLQATSIFSPQIHEICNGVVAYGASKGRGSMQATWMPQALRGKTIDELEKIRQNSSKKQGIENDIKEYISTLETNKNLLLFLPYVFRFEECSVLEDDIATVVFYIHKDFSVSLKYRAELLPQLDTFFVFLYYDYFVLCKWENQSLMFLEAISTDKSSTFISLKNYSEMI